MTSKLILDATSGHRAMWTDKDNPLAIFLDKRSDAELAGALETVKVGAHWTPNWQPKEPTTVGDYRDLSRYPDDSFPFVVFDPSHILYSGNNPGFLEARYGKLNPETWQSDLKRAAEELWRVTARPGILAFKWNDNHIRVKRVLELFPVQPTITSGRVGGSRGVRKNSSTEPRSSTAWFMFFKPPAEATL